MNIIQSSCSMRLKPNENSPLETECLFGETVEVLDNYSSWLYCRLLTDNYKGWIIKNCVGYIPSTTHRVISKMSLLYETKNVKSNCIHYLPLGSQLSVEKIEENWAVVNLSDNFKNKIAYVPSNHIVSIDNIHKDWVSVAEKLVGTPYKWGGRDSISLDCSALLQLSYQTSGINIPRNTIDQVKIKNKIIYDIDKLDRGFIVFWEGHVGIMVDRYNCIHANATHMKTTLEPLNDIILRMNKENDLIKIMDFN